MKMKRWLKRNKVFFETIAAALLALMAVVVGVAQWYVAKKQSDLAERQILLSTDPVVVLQPCDTIEGKDGVFHLDLGNIGIVDVRNVRVFGNLLHCQIDKNVSGNTINLSASTMTLPGSIATGPFAQFGEIRAGASVPLVLNVFRTREVVPKTGIWFYRVRTDYVRRLDGKGLSTTWVFMVFSPNMLLNIDNEGMSAVPGISLAKQMLKGDF